MILPSSRRLVHDSEMTVPSSKTPSHGMEEVPVRILFNMLAVVNDERNFLMTHDAECQRNIRGRVALKLGTNVLWKPSVLRITSTYRCLTCRFRSFLSGKSAESTLAEAVLEAAS
jgi:hypothetical protein